MPIFIDVWSVLERIDDYKLQKKNRDKYNFSVSTPSPTLDVVDPAVGVLSLVATGG